MKPASQIFWVYLLYSYSVTGLSLEAQGESRFLPGNLVNEGEDKSICSLDRSV